MPKGYPGRTERPCPACGVVLISGRTSRCNPCRSKYVSEYIADPEFYEERLQKRRARQQAKRAFWKDQQCWKCGEFPAQRHHPDHNDPLAIVWLCQSCHNKEPRK